MKLVNLTPHAVTIRCADGAWLTVPPSGQVARCAAESHVLRTVTASSDAGEVRIPLSRVTFGEVTGLPPEAGQWANFLSDEEETLYIVSMLVRQAVPHRRDVASPGQLIRDAAGNVTGCDGLTVN